MNLEIISFDEVRRCRPETQPADGWHVLTPAVADQLVEIFGARRPEAGAKLFGPRDSAGADAVEFDALGSARASGVAYAPDTKWGATRVKFWLAQADARQRVWDGDVHLHPDGHFSPSSIKGLGIGDEGYGLAALNANLWLQDYFMPIVTRSGGRLRLCPWLISRDHPGEARYVELRIGPVAEFPARRYNATFEARCAAKAVENRPTIDIPNDAPVDIHTTVEKVKSAAPPRLPTMILDLDEVADRAGAELALEPEGFVFRRAHCAVRLTLAPEFPHAAPVVRVTDARARELTVPFRWCPRHDLRPEIRLAKLIRAQAFAAWLSAVLRPVQRIITRTF